MQHQYATCRGSFVLGTACGHCERCDDERSRLHRPLRAPKVFVVHEPLKVDGDGLRRAFNISPAREFGELIFLIPAGPDVPADPEASLSPMRAKLFEFTKDDYLLPIGSPMLIAWAAALACQASGGTLRMLEWQRDLKKYYVVTAHVFSNHNQET